MSAWGVSIGPPVQVRIGSRTTQAKPAAGPAVLLGDHRECLHRAGVARGEVPVARGVVWPWSRDEGHPRLALNEIRPES